MPVHATAPDPIEDRVLVLTEVGTEPFRESAAEARPGARVEACDDVGDLCARLSEGAGAVVVDETTLQAGIRSLVAALSEQPPWSDVPVVVLTSGESSADDNAERLRALAPFGHVTLLERPVRLATLTSALQSALRVRRRQYELRDHLLERERRERALRESEERFRLTADTVPDVLFTTDGGGAWDYVNRRFEEVAGRSPESALRRGWLDAVHPEERERLEIAWSRAAADGTTFEHEVRIASTNGAHRWFVLRCRPIRGQDGAIRKWFGTLTDIDDLKRAEDAVQSMNRRLEEHVRTRTALLQLLHDVAVAANEADSAEEIVRYVLRRICAHDDWTLGHAYLVSTERQDELVPSGWWHVEGPDRFARLRQATMATRLSLRDGLAGRIVRSGVAEWVEDPAAQPDWRRGLEDTEGLHSAYLVPITLHGTVVAVLEFFSGRRAAPDPKFRSAMQGIAIQVGYVIARKALERQIADLTDDTRRWMGHELHDSLGQDLTALGMLGKRLEHELERRDAPEAERAARLVRGIDDAKGKVRALVKGVLPVEVDAAGLMRSLEDLAERTSSVYEVDCAFECPEPVPVDDNFSATHMFRIAQEAAHNAAVHGRAAHVRIGLERRAGRVVLEIRDDGAGMSAAPAGGTGMGLRIMRYRASVIGATLDVEPGESRGVTVRCTLERGART